MQTPHKLIFCSALVLVVLIARSLTTASVGAARIAIDPRADGVDPIVEQRPSGSMPLQTPINPSTNGRSAQIGPQQATPTRTPTPISLGNEEALHKQ